MPVASISSCFPSRANAEKTAAPGVVIANPASGSAHQIPKGKTAIVELPGSGWQVRATDRTFGYPEVEVVGGKTRMAWQTDGFLDQVGDHHVQLAQGGQPLNLIISVTE